MTHFSNEQRVLSTLVVFPVQGHVELLHYLQSTCPEIVGHKSNKGLTADEMLPSHTES